MTAHDATPPLDEFLARYDEDDNEWWLLASGHHLNLFDEAEAAYERMRAENERLREENEAALNEIRSMREDM